jgi:glycosyltransferase involved in cell wall biosynthesis
MTLSVVIATYNRASMVREAVLTALAQSRAPDEIIVSDDASTDDTVEVIAHLAASDARVRLLRQDRNSGGIQNWNVAMAAAKGDLIAWCSDDDRYLPGHLQVSVAYLEAHPEIALVHSGFVDAIATTDGEVLVARPLRPASVLTRNGLIPYLIRYFDWPFHPSTIVMRRSILDQIGPFDPGYEFFDSEWFLRVVERFPVASLARHGVLNRRHPGNWSNRLGSAHLQRERFEMGEAAIGRWIGADNPGWLRRTLQQAFWKAVWRANARARLALTARARLRSGHVDAACAAWHGMVQDTGRRTPLSLERAGAAAIRWSCAGREPELRDPRQQVSPL